MASLYQSPLTFLDEAALKKLIDKKSYELIRLQPFILKIGNDIIIKKINVNNISSLDQLFFKKQFESIKINFCVYGSFCNDKNPDHKAINHILDKTSHLQVLSILLHIKDSIGLFQKKFKLIFDAYSKNLNILDHVMMDKLLHERRLIQLNYLKLVDLERYNRYIEILNDKNNHVNWELRNFLCLQENESLQSFLEKFIISTTNRISTIESAIRGDIKFLDENNIYYLNQNFVWSHPEYQTYFDLFQTNIDSSHADISKNFRKLSLIYHPDKVIDESKKKEYEEKFQYIYDVKEKLLSFNKENNISFLKDKLTYLEHYYLYITSLVDKDQKKTIKHQKYIEKKNYSNDNQKMDVSSSSKRWADECDDECDDDNITNLDKKFNELDINKKNISCKYFSTGYCKYGDNCKFKHEIKSAKPNNFRTRPCSFFKKGKCSKGDDCTYSHTM